MKDFIDKLELAFDKQLAEKTNFGRNQVKEMFLRACIEVLAEKPEYFQAMGEINRIGEILSKEEKTTVILTHDPKPVTVDFIDPATEDLIRVDLYKRPDHKSWALDFHNLTKNIHVVMGETCITEPTTEDLIQLYQFYKNDKYNLSNV